MHPSSAPHRPDAGHLMNRWLSLALLCNLIVDVLYIAHDQFEVPLAQFLLGSDELLSRGRIVSTFLPVGYPVLLAGFFKLAAAFHRGQAAGLYVLDVLLSAGSLCLIYCFLRMGRASARFAALAALLICLYPELLHNLSKISDTNVTALLLLAVVLAAMWLCRSRSVVAAAGLGSALGAAVLVRPNMLLLAALVLLCLDRRPRLRMAGLAACSLGVALIFYVAVTAAVHGKPFFPENGPYNAFAGNNPYSRAALLKQQNGEASIVTALDSLGVRTVMNWHVPSDQPGIHDARDLVYAPLYREQTRRFLREHPWQALQLMGVKLWTFVAPETNRYQFSSRVTPSMVVWLGLKCISAAILPAWLCLLWVQWKRRLQAANAFVIAAAVLYAAPFVLVNSDPRFRMPLAVLLLADAVRILYVLRNNRQTAAT